MLSDHRWLQVLGLQQAWSDDDASEEARAAALERYLAAIEEIAGDHGASTEDRTFADELLAVFRSHARMYVGGALQTLARLSRDASDPMVKADAGKRLAHVAERMRVAGHDISQWQAGSENTKQ